MLDWSTYTLSDFLMFSPRVYQRMFETHNTAVWPLHVLTGAFGLFIIYRLIRRIDGYDRFIFAGLGIIWLWIAWSFFWERFSQIYWPAYYVAPIMALQGILLVWTGVAKSNLIAIPTRNMHHNISVIVFAVALLGYPLVALLAQRSWRSAEVFGIAPDPTAIATLVLLSFTRFSTNWAFFVVPFFWALLTGLTHWAMATGEFALSPMLAIIIACTALAYKSRAYPQ